MRFMRKGLGMVVINRKSLTDFGVFLTNAGIYTAPDPKYEKVSVDGRIGDLIIETGGFSNIVVSYPSVIFGDFDKRFVALRSFLLSQRGYCRIEDTFTPDRFRMGRPTGNFTPKSVNGHQTRIFDIQFDCKPQWYLKSGEEPIEIDANTTVSILNPTDFEALPKITVTAGTGDLIVNNQHANLSANNGATVIDSEIQDAYEGATNRNQDLTLTGGYPVLKPGVNSIKTPAGMTISIVPRWWMI